MEGARRNLELKELIERGLSQGISQVQAAGSPLHPFFIDESGKLYLLFDNVGGMDPMQLALPAIKSQTPDIQRCVLVLDARIAGADGRKMDAIVVMACERGAEFGEVWAQRYVPKGFLRKFRVEGAAEKVADARNFIAAAFEDS